jgi:flagellum-specific peptidoglycan hydrolase FlgJ
MFLLVIEAAGVTSTMHEREMSLTLNDNVIKHMPLTMDNLITVIKYYDIQHPEIVLAQAILETGWFQSDNCKKHNNLFGLYNSKRKNFYKFKHWSDSVKAYSSMIQYRYNTGDYYAWLNKIGYAEDRSYTTKLKGLVKRENLKKRVNGEV